MTDFLGRLFDRSSCLEASSGALLETLCTGRWRISQGQCSSTIQYWTVNKTVVRGGTRRHYPLVPPTPTGPPGYYYWYVFLHILFFGDLLILEISSFLDILIYRGPAGLGFPRLSIGIPCLSPASHHHPPPPPRPGNPPPAWGS